MPLRQAERLPVVTLAMAKLPSLKPGEMLVLEGLPLIQPDRRRAYKGVGSVAQNLFGAGKFRVSAPEKMTSMQVTRLKALQATSG